MNTLEQLKETISEIQKRLGHAFNDPHLLVNACTHRSFVNEYQGKEQIAHNERLEFLGDAVLGVIVSEWLFKEYPEHKEGELSSYKAFLVNKEACFSYIQHKSLEGFLLVGQGEKEISAKVNAIIYANFLEAILGALYLDAGFEKTRDWFLKAFATLLHERCSHPQQNYKALLQDWFQKKYKHPPQYQTVKESGPEHCKQFIVHVYLEADLLGRGKGSTKKEAEQHAAKDALNTIENEGLT